MHQFDGAVIATALPAMAQSLGTDPVTGCMNHRAMRRRLHEEIGRAARAEGRLACLLFDLDKFKSINDQLGHLGGDYTLRELSSVIKRGVRREDLFARYALMGGLR